MFPLRDENPSYDVPVAVVLLIGLNVAVFFLQLLSGEAERLIRQFALLAPQALHFPHGTDPGLLRWVTYMFLHGGVLHLFFNMYFLWIFGDNVEWVLGRKRFLALYFLSGLVGALAEWLLVPDTRRVPMVGASAAVSGVLGAYLWNYPRARIVTVFFFGFFPFFVGVPAFLWIGLWFLGQMFAAGAAVAVGSTGVAYVAHVGGFVTGLLLGARWAIRERRIRGQRVLRTDAGPYYRLPELEELIAVGAYAAARERILRWLEFARQNRLRRLEQSLLWYLEQVKRHEENELPL